MSKLEMSGKVLTKTEKTLKVEVIKHRTSRIYGKAVKIRKRYLVHNPNNEYEIGSNITIRECRPISKLKRFEAVGFASH